MNMKPNAAPAASPSSRPEPDMPLASPRAEPLAATSTMAGSAISTPASASTVGRSPIAIPAATGTPAAATAETGPTTLICPRARPRYSMVVPIPPPRPLARPQATACTVGPGPPMTRSATQARAAATDEPTTLTGSAPSLRDAKPPAKSEPPYRRAAARPRMTPIVLCFLGSRGDAVGEDDDAGVEGERAGQFQLGGRGRAEQQA